MKIVGLTIVRNEAWCIEFCLRVSLQWCDEVLVMFDRCTDQTSLLVSCMELEYPGKIRTMASKPGMVWDEMTLRQQMLDYARTHMAGTHFAIVDGDEAMTTNLMPDIRRFFSSLSRGELLDLPMLAARTLEEYHHDNTVWSRAMITLGFCDMPTLTWRPGADGYQHHHRAPYGHTGSQTPLNRDKSRGGVIHFQFANTRRLLAKHALYKMVDHLRWPGRETVAALNFKYGQAPYPVNASYAQIPKHWWAADKKLIDMTDVPYQEEEIKKLIEKHGRAAFAGLDLFGY